MVDYAVFHEGKNYIILCDQQDCDKFPKICATDWGAEVAIRSHFYETFGPTHRAYYEEL